MKKFFLPVLFVFISTDIVYAQAGTEPASSLLWEVSGKGIKKPSYLFGTFHIICRDAFKITPLLKDKFNSTSLLFEEMKMDDPTIQLQMMQKMKWDKNLKDIIDSVRYKRMADSFQKITGMPMGFFSGYKPFLLTSMLAQKMVDCKNPLQPENEFIRLAKEKKMEVKGLETIDDEIAAIDKVSIDSQLYGLDQLFNNFDSVKQVMRLFMNMYTKGNIDSLYLFMKNSGLGGEFETALLEERNAKWLPVIEINLKKQPAFFAFGAGHMGGEKGIINLLRKRGYKVKPVVY